MVSWRRVVERGGFFLRVLRTLGGKNIGNAASGRISTRFCRHCRTSVEPAPCKHPRQDACWGMRCFVHRFLISGPDLGIDAGENGFACYDRRDNCLPRPNLIFVAAKKNSFACCARSGSDLLRPILIFVASKKNSFACCVRSGNDLPRPILISVVAKKICSAYCGRCCSDS